MNVKDNAPYIAAAISVAWSVSSAYDLTASTATLVNGPARIHLMESQGRLQISAYFSNDLYKHRSYNAPHHSITVSLTKASSQIAGDIKRRLLPAYEAELKTLIERRDAKNKYDAAKLATYTKALRFLGKVNTDTNPDRLHAYFGQHSIQVSANNETTVELSGFAVTPAQLLRIKEVVPELFAEVDRG